MYVRSIPSNTLTHDLMGVAESLAESRGLESVDGISVRVEYPSSNEQDSLCALDEEFKTSIDF